MWSCSLGTGISQDAPKHSPVAGCSPDRGHLGARAALYRRCGPWPLPFFSPLRCGDAVDSQRHSHRFQNVTGPRQRPRCQRRTWPTHTKKQRRMLGVSR
jgi:hypothetical protein